LSATEAAEMLGVSKATLYAYGSRGWIRSQVSGLSSRERRTLTEAVYKLSERKEYPYRVKISIA
jgi:predicted site-specific integrase-resolvase